MNFEISHLKLNFYRADKKWKYAEVLGFLQRYCVVLTRTISIKWVHSCYFQKTSDNSVWRR